MTSFKIWCNTSAEVYAVLSKMESDGILWSNGSRPTSCSRTKYLGFPISFFVDANGILTWGQSKDFFVKDRRKEIFVEDYCYVPRKYTLLKKIKNAINKFINWGVL